MYDQTFATGTYRNTQKVFVPFGPGKAGSAAEGILGRLAVPTYVYIGEGQRRTAQRPASASQVLSRTKIHCIRALRELGPTFNILTISG